ncbi:MAG: transcription antitermination factor NusB [Lawsonella sp.]
MTASSYKKPARPGKRHKARLRAMTLLFEAESRDSDPIALAEERRDRALELAESGEGGMSLVGDYAMTLVRGVAVEIDRIDEVIADHLTDWTVDRLAAVDRSVLRVAVWELLFGPADVPPVTAVDEAVSIVREYSDDDAPGFVNSVLDKILKNLPELKTPSTQ